MRRTDLFRSLVPARLFRVPLALSAVAFALAAPALASITVHTIGHVTWHPAGYVNHTVAMKGYLLKVEHGYVILSDEDGGSISAHDLPVIGAGWNTFEPDKLYLIQGRFVKGGLKASNGNAYHLVMTVPPQLLSK